MTSPNLVQLKQAGDSVMMHITRCGPVGVGRFPEIEFAGIDGGRDVVVQMPKSSADRQLTRLKLDQASVVGKIITISRSPSDDPAKPYWNISLNGTAPLPVPQPAQPTNGYKGPSVGETAADATVMPPEPQDRATKLKAVFALQEVCFTHALKLAAAAESKGVAPTFEGVSALTAQAMIEASRRGVV
jgi:hypothetical protein